MAKASDLVTREDLFYIQTHPVEWVTVAFGDDLWAKQKEILESLRDNRRTAVITCHGIGKSFISSRAIQWFSQNFPDSKTISTAPSFRQVEDIIWREVRASRAKARIPLAGKFNKTAIDIDANWFALGLSTNEPDRFQGFHAVDILLVIDEAAGVNEEIFEASEGIVSSDNARVIYFGNPTSVAGTFYQVSKSSTFNVIHISAFDTPNFTHFGITVEDIRKNTWTEKITGPLPRPYLVTPDWVHDKYERWGETHPMWQARVLGQFPNQSERTLIPLDLIEKAIVKYEDKKYDIGSGEQIGVDVARYGVDKTIFCYRLGEAALDWREFTTQDTYVTGQNLSTFMQTHPGTQAFVDEPGVGVGVIDPLKHTMFGHLVHGINTGRAAKDPEHYENLRAELYFHLRELFFQGKIAIPPDEELKAQLAGLEYTVKNNRLFIEKKEDMKKRGLDSPDKADALALAFGDFATYQVGSSLLEYMKNVISLG